MLTIFIQAIIPILSGIIAYVTWLYQKEKEKRINVQNQLSEKKYLVYNEIFNLFFEIFQNTLNKKEHSAQELEERMLSIVKGLTIYASDAVLKKFSSWKANSKTETTPEQVKLSFKQFLDVLIEIRKDMGNYKSKMNYDDILGMIILNYNTEKANLGF
ncbi:hypothetical protein GCM10027049_22660 [Mucilaginibacter puniceus]